MTTRSRTSDRAIGRGRPRTGQGDDLVFPLGDLNFLVSEVKQTDDGIRASITVRRGADILASDRVPLWSLQRRRKFAAGLNGECAEDVEQHLLHIREALTQTLQNRPAAENTDQEIVAVTDVEPWNESVDGAEILDEIGTSLRRFLALPAHAAVAIALWVMASHAMAVFEVFPLLAITSPTKRCGKTTLLSILAWLLQRALSASNITAAALYRAIAQYGPSLLIDEADTFLHGNDELRGIINAGHTKATAFVLRVEGDGDNRRVVPYSTWCPRVLALIGTPPSTIEDRAVAISMRRRAKDERVARARARTLRPLRDLGRKIGRWVADHVGDLAQADPPLPDDLDDRARDNWLPLIAVADLAGGPWPDRARQAAVALSAGRDTQDDELGTRLLRNIRQVFTGKATDKLSSKDLVSALGLDEESGWTTAWKGKGLDQRKLARLLAPFHIGPRVIRIGDETARGYAVDQFADAWSRYLDAEPQQAKQANETNTLDHLSERNNTPRVTETQPDLTTGKNSSVADVTEHTSPEGQTEELVGSAVEWEEV